MKVCPKCHVSWGDDVKFCSACGEPLPEAEAVNEAVNEAPAAEPAQEAPAAEPVNNGPAAAPTYQQAPQNQTYQQVPPAAQNPAYRQVPPAYQPPYYQQPAEEHIGLGKWVLYQLIPAIPFVGSIIYLVMLFVWGFGSDKNPTFRNWAKSQLVFMGISLVLVILVFVIVFVIAGASLGAMSTETVW